MRVATSLREVCERGRDGAEFTGASQYDVPEEAAVCPPLPDGWGAAISKKYQRVFYKHGPSGRGLGSGYDHDDRGVVLS